MMQGSQIPAGMEEGRLFVFSAPAALDQDVLGVDSQTGETFINLRTINEIIRGIEDLAQGADRKYEYDITRDGYLVRTIRSDQIKAELQGPTWAGFPLGLQDAVYQIVMRQTVLGSGLQAREVNWIFKKSLA